MIGSFSDSVWSSSNKNRSATWWHIKALDHPATECRNLWSKYSAAIKHIAGYYCRRDLFVLVSYYVDSVKDFTQSLDRYKRSFWFNIDSLNPTSLHNLILLCVKWEMKYLFCTDADPSCLVFLLSPFLCYSSFKV